ncbi:diguanylate cyclase [uncultured Roseobacter sp.]|uniref:diguanylate cyclase domain-containing protein n=1 Tax=uncultured Roseobacter sp. TaxID=114847 RepID=UPI00261A1518|nr:diguanylate cyclase [uncultured Roseobacter sp.]
MSEADTFGRMLDVLCPMHLILDQDGIIINAGPTTQKLFPEAPLAGQVFLDVFEIRRPRQITEFHDLADMAGNRLHVMYRTDPPRELKGILVPGPSKGQVTLNLSFGISVVEAVQEYELTARDFAVTDLTVEMLYLVEAKSAAMEASRQLNKRLQSAREEAEEQAVTDVLTGLKNRRAMDIDLARALAVREDVALMHIDLDYFKDVNDTLGHAAGDHVLQEVARVMREETRSTDTIARVGGDEFVVLMRSVRDELVPVHVAGRIIEKLMVPIMFEGQPCRVSASIGTVLSSEYARPSADQMLRDADEALYHSKHEGRGRHTLYSELSALSAVEAESGTG